MKAAPVEVDVRAKGLLMCDRDACNSTLVLMSSSALTADDLRKATVAAGEAIGWLVDEEIVCPACGARSAP